MPKRIFWPITLIIMGLIFMASNMGYLPTALWNFWPIILIIVGLSGLITSDREEWLHVEQKPTTRKTASKKKKQNKK